MMMMVINKVLNCIRYSCLYVLWKSCNHRTSHNAAKSSLPRPVLYDIREKTLLTWKILLTNTSNLSSVTKSREYQRKWWAKFCTNSGELKNISNKITQPPFLSGEHRFSWTWKLVCYMGLLPTLGFIQFCMVD